MQDQASVTTQPPGGSWSDRKPSFIKTVKALFRRSFLVKIRDAGTIVSEVIATILLIILWILWRFGTRTHDAAPSPKIGSYNLLWGGSELPAMVTLFNKDLVLGRGGHWVAAPDYPKVHQMIDQYYGHQKIPIVDTSDITDVTKWKNVSFNEYWVYVNDKEGVQDSFDSVDSFSNGIQWVNAPKTDEDVEWTKNMSIVLYENQNLIMFFSENSICASTMAYAGAGMYRSNAAKKIEAGLRNETGIPTLVLPGFNKAGDQTAIFTTPRISQQIFARPKVENEIPINIAVAFFAAIPIVIASMPDLTMILTDKDTHIMTFTYLMGASEPAYWLVSFVSTFIMCFIPYFVMDLCFCFWFCMNGTNFLLLLLLSIFFIISYIMFQAFLSTFFKTAASGRVLTVIFLILIVFFGYLNEVYTLDAKDSVKHVLSLFPIECYELVISVMYEEVRNKREPFGFALAGKGTDVYRYPVYWAFLWFIADTVIWFILFLFFNAVLDRGFGAPLIRWRDLFRCNFRQQKDIELENIEDGQYIMQVEGLKKQYSGKQTFAVDDVSFKIKRGEIIVMIGPNGAGKSSIINTVSGAIPATAGTLQLGQDEPSDLFAGIQKCLGIVFQDNVIIKLLSIREHLEIYGAFRGIDDDVLQQAIDFFADTLQLKEMLPNRAGDLSGGQKRKLCIALALLGNPPIIIMDEPTAGVDVQARQLIWKTISNLKDSTCIITTHALEEAEAVSSRMFVVSRGKLPFVGTSSELREEFKCGYLLKLDSEPEAMDGILRFVQGYVPNAKTLPDRDDTITLPVDGQIPVMLSNLDQHKEELGFEDYSFSVEQLEDVLLRILETS
jgi:ABC-type multidrug transport system ATPase subunit